MICESLDMPQEALEYGYQAWRKDRQRPEIAMPYFILMVKISNTKPVSLDVAKVQVDGVATVEFEDGTEKDFVITSRGEAKYPDEYDEDRPEAQALLGKAKGEEMRPKVKIGRILHKYIWAHKKTMEDHSRTILAEEPPLRKVEGTFPPKTVPEVIRGSKPLE